MELHLIVNSFACINLLVVMQRKLLFIDLKTYLVTKKRYIHFFADAPKLKQYEIVCKILVLVIVPALCGTVVSLFYGHIYPPFITKI